MLGKEIDNVPTCLQVLQTMLSVMSFESPEFSIIEREGEGTFFSNLSSETQETETESHGTTVTVFVFGSSEDESFS